MKDFLCMFLFIRKTVMEAKVERVGNQYTDAVVMKLTVNMIIYIYTECSMIMSFFCLSILHE